MWDVKSVRKGEESVLLKEGWEPFGLVAHDTSYSFFNTSTHKDDVCHQTTDCIYLRKEVQGLEPPPANPDHF